MSEEKSNIKTKMLPQIVAVILGVPVQRILDTRADSFMETFRLVD